MLLRELLLATAAATALCALLSFIQEFVPLVRANLYVLVAALFLYLPAELLRRRGLSTYDVGLTSRPRLKGLLFAAVTILVVFPPFALGFHAWQSWLFGAQPHFSEDSYRRWPAEWEGRPGRTAGRDGVALWTEGNALHLRWTPLAGERLGLEFESDGRLEPLGRVAGVRLEAPGRLTVRPRGPGELRLRVHGGERLQLGVTTNGQPLSEARVALGAGAATPDDLPLAGERSLVWLLLMVLSHLLLVALPEELFYRGYLQTGLDQVWTARIRVLGAQIGPALLVTSVLFALGHYLVDFRVARLAVFFPALLFGWLRIRTGSLFAPILVHAASNVFSDLLGKGYLP